jgi:hypothetical protein
LVFLVGQSPTWSKHSQQAITEPALEEVTNQVKPGVGKYQAATRVKVLSPVITNVEEADSFHVLEGRIICIAKARDGLLLRGLSPWHDTAWKHQELGRTMSFPVRSHQRAEEARRRYGDMVVGLTHSRGVIGVMPDESGSRRTLEGVSSNV